MKRLLFLLLLLPALAIGEPERWLKYQLNPEQLYIIATSSSDCPMSTEEVEKETQNVLVRSRIKPLEGGGLLGYPYLSVSTNCLKVPRSPNVFAVIRIDFVHIATLNASSSALRPDIARKLPGYDMIIKARLGEELFAGSLHIADKDSLKSAVKEHVENFMVDYLKANFNLGEDQ